MFYYIQFDFIFVWWFWAYSKLSVFWPFGLLIWRGPVLAKVPFGVTLHRVMAAAMVSLDLLFRAKRDIRKVPIFGGAYCCVCLLIFEIWWCMIHGNWFWSVLMWETDRNQFNLFQIELSCLLSCYFYRTPWKIGPKTLLDYIDPYHQTCRVYIILLWQMEITSEIIKGWVKVTPCPLFCLTR
jgi:hypothetical protein